MFKHFSKLIDHSYAPKKGRIDNVFKYINLCEQIKTLVDSDETLQRLHQQRIVNNIEAYAGDSKNLLVQDIIYAATFHFKEVKPEKTIDNTTVAIIIEDAEVEAIPPSNREKVFRGTIIRNELKITVHFDLQIFPLGIPSASGSQKIKIPRIFLFCSCCKKPYVARLCAAIPSALRFIHFNVHWTLTLRDRSFMP